jgi:hypothetical protein
MWSKRRHRRPGAVSHLGINEMDPPLDGAAVRSHNGAETILTITPKERVP